jgi:DNA-directed RNA polymerase subunit M/transcription elongation factor TFIIS
MKESLTCTGCGATWKRDKSRGRKPHFCPKCVKLQLQETAAKEVKPRKIKVEPVVQKKSPQTEELQISVQSKIKSDLTVSQVINSLNPKRHDSAQLAESTKSGSTWQCPSCKSVTELFVSVNDIPTHRCTPSTVTVKLMERIK